MAHRKVSNTKNDREIYALLLLVLLSWPMVFAGAQAQERGNSRQWAGRIAGSPMAQDSAEITFDAASIRPSNQKGFLRGVDFLDPVSGLAPPPGGLFSWNVPIGFLIVFAYDLRSPQLRSQASQTIPKSMQQEWYTIEARATGNPTRTEVQQMVRSMLRQRFQLIAHLENRAGEVFKLQVAKPGLGLKPHPAGAPCALSSSLMDENKYPHAYPSYKGFSPRCGVFNRELSHSGDRRLEMLDVTMQQIANSLMLPLAVIDDTGLLGRYDAVLDIGSNSIPQDPETSDELGLPPIPVALEKQLGLRLMKQNAQVDVFVMDHIGALSEN